MNITDINFKFYTYTQSFDHILEWDLPLVGDDRVIKQTNWESYETSVKTYRLTQETVDSLIGLIEQYGIKDWIGKEPLASRICDGEHSAASCLLTLKFEDGTEGKVTFREVPEETGREASGAFRKFFFSSMEEDALLSEETLYPTLAEARKIKEEHGPVVGLETHGFSMGMMCDSNQTNKTLIDKIPDKDGMVRVTIKEQRGRQPEVSDSAEIVSDILEKVQEISDRENLPGWNYCSRDPRIPVDTSMMATDYSSSFSLTVIYDDSLITGFPAVRRTIGDVVCEMGGRDVRTSINDLIRDCVAAAGVHIESPNINPFLQGITPLSPMPLAGMGMTGITEMMKHQQDAALASITPGTSTGPWDCSSCGTKGNTGKFCPGCGTPRP
ncbi:MAG: hypothetical protein IK001_00130 [Lachnospiraceae bacterium]|nr:hypothetical protein [Lachnospiraceae bacterium]